MKRKLSAFLVVMMIISILAVGASASAPLSEGHITPLMAGSNGIFVYYPANSAADSSLVKLIGTAPTFVLYGDSSYYTEEEAKAYIEGLGLARIAAAEGGVVILVNGSSSEGWTEADIPSYGAVIGKLSESSTVAFSKGVAANGNISGSRGRIHLYGIGTGADFIAENFMKQVLVSITFSPVTTIIFDFTPVSYTLVGAAVNPVIDESVLPASEGYKSEIRVAAIDSAPVYRNALKAICTSGNNNSYVLNSTRKSSQAELINKAYYEFGGQYRRQIGVLIPITDYAREGIVEKPESYTIPGTSTTINYVTYYARNLLNGKRPHKVPLVLGFHGGGGSALSHAQLSQLPEVGKKYGFIAVTVDAHGPTGQIIELINHLKTQYPIDESRIYATGFSMGSVKSFALAEDYPEVFAGIAPMSGSFGAPSSVGDLIVPTIYIGGNVSPLPELANQGPQIQTRIDWILKTNQVMDNYVYDPDVNFWWGVEGDLSYEVPDKQYFLDSVLEVDLFYSTDGNIYTALGVATNMSHEVYARNTWAAYEFLRQFSRNSDGSITVNPLNNRVVK